MPAPLATGPRHDALDGMEKRIDALEGAAALPLPGNAGLLRRPEVTVVLPTYNERDNIAQAVERVAEALAGRAWEIIVVDDDSPDRTHEVARAIGERDPRVRCIRRVGRRGLSGACIEGMLAAAAPVVAVMDADLQHDERLLAPMLELVETGEADVAVGSRFVAGANASGGLSSVRETGSRVANLFTRTLLGVRLTDPMSGFFMLRRETVERLSPKLTRYGFKILLDIVASDRGRLGVAELPYTFRERVAGESKLDSRVVAELVALIVSKLFGGLLSVRFVLFGFIGASGLVVHMSVLYGLLVAGLHFNWAQAAATIVAMTTNFFLNNWLTFRDRQLHGWAMLRGLLSFYAICGVGVIGNVGIASVIYAYNEVWWIAGIAGALVGAVWNYAASAALTWRVR